MEDRQTTKTKTKRRFLWVFGLLVLLCVIMRLTVLDPRDPGIVFGPDTTHVDAPKNPDGTPNYVAWLNQKYSKGVTADNNAAVLIAKVLESRYSVSSYAPGLTEEDLARLKLDQLPEPGRVFVSFEKFTEAPHKSSKPGEKIEQRDTVNIRKLVTKTWSEQDYPQVSRWIDKNKQALDTLVAASERPRYFAPLFISKDSLVLNEVLYGWDPHMQRAELALALRATRSLKRGDANAAWNDAMALCRLGRLLSQSPFLLDHLVGYSLDSRGQAVIVALAASDRLDSPSIRKYLAEMNMLAEFRSRANWLLMERLSLLDVVMSYRRGDAFEEGELQAEKLNYNSVLRHCNLYWDSMYKVMKLPARDRQKEADRILKSFKTKDGEEFRTPQILFRVGGRLFEDAFAERLSEVIVARFAPAIGRVPDIRMTCMVRSDLSKTVLALTAYKADTGVYPKALDALKPTYLAEIPQDPFSHAPLVYKPSGEGYVLYSIGPDGVDDGGVSEDTRTHRLKDIVVRIPVEEK